VSQGGGVVSELEASEILRRLKSHSNPEAVKGMARFGINPRNTYGVSIPVLRALAKEIGKNHALAQKLWNSGMHEARILASMIDVPDRVTKAQMERWVKDFDSWDVCDQCCSNLFDKTKTAFEEAYGWSSRREEFVKRAGFALMAVLVSHDTEAPNANFLKCLNAIEKEADDERNFVRKAVNWALRGIGKRNLPLNKAAIRTAKAIHKMNSRAARWIASDALRELLSEPVQKTLREKR
jgi:3-methyladenine DNA glycosylase AlkD